VNQKPIGDGILKDAKRSDYAGVLHKMANGKARIRATRIMSLAGTSGIPFLRKPGSITSTGGNKKTSGQQT
jgi:hypothetical protein